MNLKTRPYDVVAYLRDEADRAGLLEVALEDGHPGVVAMALGDVARALGMTDVAPRAGLGRESLYKALSANGNPEFTTIMKVIDALGSRLSVKPAGKPGTTPVRARARRQAPAKTRKRAFVRKRLGPTRAKGDAQAGRPKVIPHNGRRGSHAVCRD